MNPKIIAGCLIAQYLSMAFLYSFAGDWRHMLYWTAAAALTVAVTF